MAYEVTIARAGIEAMLDLRGPPEKIAQCLADLSLAPPTLANSALVHGESVVLWVGPRRWLISAPLSREAELQQLAERAPDEVEISVILISDYYSRFDLDGRQVRDVLAQATPLDLRPAVFGPGTASFSEFFGIGALLYCTAATSCRVYVERSYGDFIHARLRRAAG